MRPSASQAACSMNWSMPVAGSKWNHRCSESTKSSSAIAERQQPRRAFAAHDGPQQQRSGQRQERHPGQDVVGDERQSAFLLALQAQVDDEHRHAHGERPGVEPDQAVLQQPQRASRPPPRPAPIR